jgi:hypothetical protein
MKFNSIANILLSVALFSGLASSAPLPTGDGEIQVSSITISGHMKWADARIG